MSKVKLTREQAKALELAIEEFGNDRVMDSVLRNWDRGFESLNLLKPSELARAIYDDGFEVEETFEVGDCVVLNDGKIVEIIEDESFTVIVGWIINGSMYRDQINKSLIKRHATKQEKWWAKHGRKPLELKINDVLLRNDGAYVSVLDVDKSQGKYELVYRGPYANCYEIDKEKIDAFYKVICFSEDRKDVDHAE